MGHKTIGLVVDSEMIYRLLVNLDPTVAELPREDVWENILVLDFPKDGHWVLMPAETFNRHFDYMMGTGEKVKFFDVVKE